MVCLFLRLIFRPVEPVPSVGVDGTDCPPFRLTSFHRLTSAQARGGSTFSVVYPYIRHLFAAFLTEAFVTLGATFTAFPRRWPSIPFLFPSGLSFIHPFPNLVPKQVDRSFPGGVGWSVSCFRYGASISPPWLSQQWNSTLSSFAGAPVRPSAAVHH